MRGMEVKRIGEVSMVKYQKNGWMPALLFVGVAFLMSQGVLAENDDSVSVSQLFQCQNSIKQYSLQLEKWSKIRSNQPYYEDLYNQTREFLDGKETISADSSQLVRCENLLKVVQDIVGRHKGSTNLAPMPQYSTPSRGKLTKGVLETGARRPMRKHVEYMYDSSAKKLKKESKEQAEANEEVEQLHLISKPPHRSSRGTKRNVSGEPKEIE
jgi:hypothetical protein